ncbi:MAG: caspase family protein [Raineya sp.]|jgi:tetratricopeptide (TPR) repeat protein|nr:caspase family protein [Raineya sp.]
MFGLSNYFKTILFTALWLPCVAFSQVQDYLKSGKVQFQEKKYIEAIVDFSEAIRLDTQNDEAYYSRALAYTKMQNFQKALLDIQQAIHLKKDKAIYFIERGKIYFELKNYEKAVQDLSQAIFLEPEKAHSYSIRALVRLALQDYEGALQDSEKSLKIDSTITQSYAEQGIALAMLNYKQESQLCFDKFLQSNQAEKYYTLAHNSLIYGFRNKTLLVKSENWALKAVQLQDNYKHNYLYACILDAQNKKLNALDVCQKAISLAKKENTDYSDAEKLLEKINLGNVDDIPPVITLVSPVVVRGGIVVSRQDEVSIIGRVTDESGVKDVFINGNPARVLPNGDFNGIAILKKDTKFLTIEATDQKGNTEKINYNIIWQLDNSVSDKRFKNVGKSYALIFATNQYEYWNNLSNPIPDAESVAKDLKDLYGYEIDLVLNPTQNQTILKLKEYLQKKFQPNDQLLIFFAGHGQFDETFGEGYVVAKDSRLDDEAKSSYLSYATLRTYINNMQCKHILLMMDVCFGGTFDPQLASKNLRGNETPVKPNDDEIEAFINRKLQSKTRRYITSGGKEYVSDGSPGQHSPFVRKFLEALRSYGGKDRVMTIAEILTYLETITPQPHHGEFGSNEPGSDFLMIGK